MTIECQYDISIYCHYCWVFAAAVVGNGGGCGVGNFGSCSVGCAAAAGREFYYLLNLKCFDLCASSDVAKFIESIKMHKLYKYDSANTPIIWI